VGGVTHAGRAGWDDALMENHTLTEIKRMDFDQGHVFVAYCTCGWQCPAVDTAEQASADQAAHARQAADKA